LLLIKRYQEPPHRQSLGVLEQPGALIKKTHCEPPQAAPMGVLEQNKVFKKTGLVAERFKAVVLKTIIAHTITSSNLVLPLPGCPYRRTPSYQSTRRVVVFDLEGTGAA
jgi:hypothetical protein